MKLKNTLFLWAFIGLLLAACRTPEPTPAPAPTATAVVEPTDTVVPPTPEPEPTAVPSPTPEPTEEPLGDLAPILNDEGGVVSITGVITYTNPFFTLGVAAPLVILEDQAGFVDRNETFLMPVESQTLGQITSDFLTSPFSYSIALPIEPQGTLRDVDHDGKEESGVQVFAIAYWNNVFGDPFLEERDLGGGGWSTAYASTRISEEAETEREIVGGKFLVYAPDDQQGFPSGFGEDGLLFTEDDPIVILPQGYTVVDMDTDPFTFDRSRHQKIDLVEPEGAALVDYSDLSYTEAFDALVDQLRLEYAFTEYKGIDWDALQEEFRPRFETADRRHSNTLYRQALRDFAWSIPDGHVSGPFIREEFQNAAGGGIGIAIRELDDGRVLVNFLLDDSPAARAGLEFGAEIVAINGIDITEYISDTVSYFGPYSTIHDQRLDQQLFATRFPVGTEVEVTFLNPGSSTIQTTQLVASPEVDSFNFWLQDSDRDGFELPVEYQVLDSGFGYAQIFSFADNDLLTVQLWERMIQAMNDNDVPAIIVDMRQNGGGRGFLADQMAAYFFDEQLVTGRTAVYDKDRGEFYFDPRGEQHFYLPAEELRYHGDLVVLVGADCASACEFFSYDLTLQDRAVVVGHTPTAGLGGSIDRVAMPDDEEFTFTQGRAVDTDGNIHIEGIGVVPDIRVPVDEAAVFSDGDPVLEAAVRFLTGDILDGGILHLGDVVTGSLPPKTRVRYSLTLSEGDMFSIVLEGASGRRDMVLYFYADDGSDLGSTEGDESAVIGLTSPGELNLIIEVAAVEDAGEEAYTLRIIDEG